MLLTPEQKLEDQIRRQKIFMDGLKKLREETMIDMKPQISPDGPVITIVDTKKYD